MKRLLNAIAVTTITTFALSGSAVAQQPSKSAKWTKTYVIEWNEPAMYYGAETGVIEPGTDCPGGTNGSPDGLDWVQIMVNAGYTLAEAEWLRNPENPSRSPVNGQNQMAFRGKDRANVYTNPTSYPDPGMVGVSGTIAEGINLDDDEQTGFISPTGDKGIDNNFYKTLGCWKTYRGPRRLSSGALQFNDSMRNGSWTTVVVVAGQGVDFMNDDHVTVGFYASNDKMYKDGLGNIARDYTFRIAPHAKYEGIFPARTVNGRILSTAPADIMMRDPGYTRDLELLRARVDLEMKPDGSLVGLVGGYRPWEPVYRGWVNARGPVIESLTWVELPSVFYALRRNADFSPTGPGGERTHISYALRIDALPAFVMTPDATKEVASVETYKAVAPRQAAAGAATGFASDGIVPNRRYPAGPNAVILPSTSSANPGP